MSTGFQPAAFQPNAFQIPGGVTVVAFECDPGSYSIDGSDCDFLIVGSLTFECDAGSYAISGQACDFLTGDGLLDPKYAPKRRRYPNVEFRAPGQRKRREPAVARAPAPPAPKPKARPSPLLRGLMQELLDDAQALSPLELLEQVVLPVEVPAIAPAIALAPPAIAPAPAPDPLAAMQAQLAAMQAQIDELQARVDAGVQPVSTARDPLHEALHAILPGLDQPIDLSDPAEDLRVENERRAREITERLLADL